MSDMASSNDNGNHGNIISFSNITGPADFKAPWLKDCQMDAPDRPTNNLANALVALRTDPDLSSLVAHNGMLYTSMLMKPLPATTAAAKEFMPRRFTDTDATAIQEYLQRGGLKRISNDVVHKAIELRATENSFHPGREYFESLKWDGKKRLSTWLSIFLGAEQTLYIEAIGKMFLISIVARTFSPGCQVDYMMVLEGRQGTGKSTACRVLGGPYFSDSLPDITGGKDVSQHLPGKMLIEMGELSALGKAESAALKAFLTRTVEQYRRSYGRNEVVEPRQCVFIGTTNKTAYLRDETGGRRFWPVKVAITHAIDAKGLQENRDQLFAEAFELFKSGAPWHPDSDFEQTHILPEQDKRYDADAWEETIRKHLIEGGLDKVYVGRLMTEALGLETSRKSRADQNRVTSILERLKWERLKKDSQGNVPWGPPPAWAEKFENYACKVKHLSTKEEIAAKL
jgi:predicted P-loop ATPase